MIARCVGAHQSAAGLILPVPDMGNSHIGVVLSKGQPARRLGRELPLELGQGQQVLYSSRVDTFAVEGHSVPIDVVEEASVIAVI